MNVPLKFLYIGGDLFLATNGVAFQTLIDEMAIASGRDPLAFRKTCCDESLKVLDMESLQLAYYIKPMKAKVSSSEAFGSIVAHALFLKKEKGGITIPKVVSVVDCGIYVNPDQVKAQTEGNIIYGLTAALKDPITFKNGAAQQANFDTYRMLRMNEAPRAIEVHLMENNEAPGGVGEPRIATYWCSLAQCSI